MPRPKRADEAGSIYHALNRGNSRETIFHKDADYEAFERIMGEGLERYSVELFVYQLMPNHWHDKQDGGSLPEPQTGILTWYLLGVLLVRGQSRLAVTRSSPE